MKVLVMGASGATGRLVVRELIKKNVQVKIVVRNMLTEFNNYIAFGELECIVGNIHGYNVEKMAGLIQDCDAVISCLGHNLTFHGLFGKPRTLVTDCVKTACEAANHNKKTVKIILMNSTAVQNRTNIEKYSYKDRILLSLLECLLPPQRDNVKAAEYLCQNINSDNPYVEWTAVRPDTLINETEVSFYEVYLSPKRSPVFDPGKTSRINVSHFFTELVINEKTWEKWKFKMPVIYNYNY